VKGCSRVGVGVGEETGCRGSRRMHVCAGAENQTIRHLDSVVYRYTEEECMVSSGRY
jgi:hypothetical protein